MTRNILFGKPIIGEAEKAAVIDVLDGPQLVHGPKMKSFEKAFADFAGAPHAVAVSSCTAGMHLFYFHLGLGPGDEVIVPAQTHAATAHAVEFCGAAPVFVDAEPGTGNIDIDKIEMAVTARTKAISVVHFLGYPVAMDRVCAIAEQHGLLVLEDCALAIGARYKGVHAGLHGAAGCFSFYPVKHITTAEGGMFITKDAAFAAAVERKRAFGVDRVAGERKVPGVYDVNMLGYNYRMNEIQSAIGIEQMKRVGGFLEKRKANYDALHAVLGEIDEVELFEKAGGDFQSAYYCLSAILSDAVAPRRFEIVERLNASGIGTSVYYPKPVPHMAYYREKYGYGENSFPVAARISANSIALPVGPHLGEEDMLYIAGAMKDAIFAVRAFK